MPNTKSAKKQMRASGRRQTRNKPVRSRAKTMVTKAEELIFSGQLDRAETEVVTSVSSLDKAVVKGVIHPNNAARRKSRLMKKLNKARAESASQT
ncbi:MAG: 30S ribosomal protein S20 [Dehalococcoidales bacterium]|nr:30S ribosomal protein S20 [Dehalococcoidales bacterium]